MYVFAYVTSKKCRGIIGIMDGNLFVYARNIIRHSDI